MLSWSTFYFSPDQEKPLFSWKSEKSGNPEKSWKSWKSGGVRGREGCQGGGVQGGARGGCTPRPCQDAMAVSGPPWVHPVRRHRPRTADVHTVPARLRQVGQSE